MNTAVVMERTGASYRQLDYWIKQGWLHPVGGVGSGNPRDWSEAEVDVAARMVVMVAAGLSPEIAAKVARTEPGAPFNLGRGVMVTFEPVEEQDVR
jgi:DNA-binding transcriptional MerR regulator